MAKLNPDMLTNDEIEHYGVLGEVEGLCPTIARRVFHNYPLPQPGWKLEDKEGEGDADSIQK